MLLAWTRTVGAGGGHGECGQTGEKIRIKIRTGRAWQWPGRSKGGIQSKLPPPRFLVGAARGMVMPFRIT